MMKHLHRPKLLHRPKHHPELFWPGLVIRKWLNISAKDSDYSADIDDDDSDLNVYSDIEEPEEFSPSSRESRFKVSRGEEEIQVDPNDAIPRIRRRKSETFRAQYINSKEIRVCVGTWNVGGKLPPDDLDIDDWVDIYNPADIYVLGLQEIVPLNAGNIFGAEDNRPVTKWENIIRETLNRIRLKPTNIKCFSDPPSPSKFKPPGDISDIEEELFLESDSDIGEEVHPVDDEVDFDQLNCTDDAKLDSPVEGDNLERQFSSPRRLDRLNCLRAEDASENGGKLSRVLSCSEKIGLCWPEPPLNLVSQQILEKTKSFKSTKSFNTTKSFRTYNSFKSTVNDVPSCIAFLEDIDLESILNRKRKPPYIRILSKQMVGVFLTIWVRRGLRRHIQNVKVSTVGVGVMGYIGNKGSISVSMSVYQTLFCFICTHLTAGEKEGDEIKRNSDVHDIHRRTIFRSLSGPALPKSIYDHERIIWLGDLNYRLNLSYEKARELIAEKNWSKLFEKDQLAQELRKGRTFDGWSEGKINFAPTYKYELNSEKYVGSDPKVGRRTPAWCDRILSYGKGMKQLSYRRSELKFSDHRPVTAVYLVEVEEFSHKKLQRALTYTDAEIENDDLVQLGNVLLEDLSDWAH